MLHITASYHLLVTHKTLLKFILLIIAFSLFLITSVYADQNKTQLSESGHLQIRKHLPSDYNSSGQCFDVEVDSLGLVYTATNSGVLIYDGSTYTLVEHPHRLPARSLVTSSEGKIYVGFRGDFGVLLPDSTGNLYVKSVLPDSILNKGIWEIWYTQTINDSIYFSSEGNLYRYLPNVKDEKSRLKIWNRGDNPGDYFINIFECFGQLMISRTFSGLQVVEGDSLVTVYSTPGSVLGVKDGIRFDDQKYLLSTSMRGMFFWDGKDLIHFPSEISTALEDMRARYLIRVSDDLFAVSTSIDGVFLFDNQGNIINRLDKSVGLSEDKTSFMCIDKENGLWIATNSGFSRCDLYNPIQFFSEESGLSGNVYAITRFNGELYLGTSSGLYKLIPSSEKGRPAHFKLIGERSSIWHFSQNENCLFIFSVNNISYITIDNPVPVDWLEGPLFALASAVTKDQNHFFYGMYHDGIGYIEWRNQKLHVIKDAIPSGLFPLNMVLENDDRELWYCADSRYIEKMDFHWDKGQLVSHEITVYDTSKGLPSSRYRSFEQQGKRYWGSDAGLYCYNEELDRMYLDTTFVSKSINKKGFENPAITSTGNIWFNTVDQNGMRLINLGNGKYSREWTFQAIKPKNIPVYYPEDTGITWAGSLNGLLYRFDRNRSVEDTSSFKALVRNVEIHGDSTLYGGFYSPDRSMPVLSPSDNSLRIRYSLPRYKMDELNEYQYRLVGLDEMWSEWSSETYHDFNSLKGGKYRFEVRGKDANGRISNIDEFQFVVLSPWYLTTWMKVVYILLGIILVFIIVRLSIRRIEQDRIRLENLVAEKTEEVLVQFERVKVAEIKAKEIEVANEMAATIAHEFNNPLAIIQLCLDTKEMKTELTDDDRSYHTKIETQVDRMKNLVQKLLELEEIKKVDYAANMKILDIHKSDE